MTNDRGNLQRRNADLRRLDKLIEQRKFRIALPFVRELMTKYPDDTIVHIGLALCLSETGQRSEALDVLQAADRRFPNDYTILYHIAETQNEVEAFEDAEHTYRKSLELTPASCHAERSECYNGLGVVLWRQHKKSDALEMWKLAMKENPRNRIAQRNLKELTNEFNEPVTAAKPMDDFRHFQNIQMEFYFQSEKKSEFSTMREAEDFFGLLMNTWNSQLADRGKGMDSMTAAEKTELFKSVRMDYSGISKAAVQHTPGPEPRKSRKPSAPGAVDRKLLAMMNERFDFLPPDTALFVITVGTDAMIAAGMDPRRLISLLRGESKVTAEEEQLILWAFDIIKGLTLAQAKKDTPDETGLILKCISVAREYLSEEEAVDVVHKIRGEIRKTIE